MSIVMGVAAPVVDRGRAEAAVRELLLALGQDPTREGLRGTPARVARMYEELVAPEPFALTTFDAEGADEMVVVSGIPFFSLCEHHMAPFFGTATVGYVPDGRIVGLSKLARVVRRHAAGLQNQERVTRAAALDLEGGLRPKGVGVVLRARHLCMEMRGARTHGTVTTTSALLGVLRSDDKARAEFLSLDDQAARP